MMMSENAIWNIDPILDPGAFINTSDPQEIFVRLENDICFAISSFFIITENCEPFIPQGFSPNGDGMNDEFEITGLLNVFPEGNLVPTGLYYYVLHLNDPQYPKAFISYVYINY